MMKEKGIQFLKKNFFAVVIALIAVFLAWQNYDPGTWLSGWDTLHPEFDFLLNLKRVISGVWREEQGLGAVAVHSHMADLPRILFLWLASLVFPVSFLRFLYFFVCLVLGPLGVYFFGRKEVFKGKLAFQTQVASFLGGLFYLLNLGTLQHFYVPFEMFAAAYAFLPWLFLFATSFFAFGKRRDLLFFSLVTFFASPMAYAATLWYAFFAFFILYGFTLLLFQNRSWPGFKKLVTLIAFTLIINSYWLLPNLYLLGSSGKNVPQAKINQLFSAEALLHDQKYATLENAAILKGFLFDWKGYSFPERGFIFLLEEWQNHLKNPLILGIGFFFFGLVVLGVLVSILKKEKSLFLLPAFLFSFVFLIYTVWPVSLLFAFISDHLQFLKEGLRFPWTKFSIFVMFSFSVYFSQAVYEITCFLKKRTLQVAANLFLTCLLVAFMAPAFTGHLIAPSRRASLPQEYFEAFDWFAKQPENGRIGTFPVHTFWGWEYYQWGFEGAGFIWFGLDQPVLVRDFDRWNPANENYYWETAYALYSGNQKLLEAVLEKYQVSFLWVDENIASVSVPKSLYFDELEKMLVASNKVSLKKTFGKIKIYKVNLETPVEDFVFLAQNVPIVGPIYEWNNFDQAYQEHGHYISSLNPRPYTLNPNLYYPFRSLFTGKNQEDLELNIRDEGDSFIFSQSLPEGLQNYELKIPQFEQKELVWVNPENLEKRVYFSPKVYPDGKVIEVKIPKIGGYLSYDNLADNELFLQELKNCDNFNKGNVESSLVIENDKKLLRLTSTAANNCLDFQMPTLSHELSYLISIEHRNVEGRSLRFWLENFNSRRPDLEAETSPKNFLTTDYFIQPPMEKYGLGYALHFDNLSIGQEKVVNDLGQITAHLLPYNFLTGIYLTNLKPSSGEVLIFSQAYDRDFLAYQTPNRLTKILPFWGKRLKNHVLVNNWANGWILEDEKTEITIVFWPQYLEYFGFLLLAGLVIFIFVGVVKERKIS